MERPQPTAPELPQPAEANVRGPRAETTAARGASGAGRTPGALDGPRDKGRLQPSALAEQLGFLVEWQLERC